MAVLSEARKLPALLWETETRTLSTCGTSGTRYCMPSTSARMARVSATIAAASAASSFQLRRKTRNVFCSSIWAATKHSSPMKT